MNAEESVTESVLQTFLKGIAMVRKRLTIIRKGSYEALNERFKRLKTRFSSLLQKILERFTSASQRFAKRLSELSRRFIFHQDN